MVVLRLEIQQPVVVLSQGGDIGFHCRFIVRIIQFESTAVETDQAYLRGEPQITVFIKKEIIDAVLRKAVLVRKMLDRVPIGRIGLRQGRCSSRKKDSNDAEPDKLVYHALTLNVKYSGNSTIEQRRTVNGGSSIQIF
jgi:hypothetical protein